ncbi:isocitrate lyase/phosphoenolpyruvate mutase family protein [Actinoplanes sp. NEAU-A12]|uniref:Isocitrate lyase/phosphoenolpyruvate mutase family protein n=1 Tax=Actinoplanes sandaracinus TaxID=3045177 RepID=A0ABT6WI86_9ACTN|nr:isocitrate lyase/phosphoenolpyruvate mutase family protein [Actinoplanes sandaracinus]MDI6099421.1 isocitrate lyase/phosphoenolpyruvate mutase family protein [Actinoplanes sandaracinus]
MVDALNTGRARALRAWHGQGVLVLPNAWDAASAGLVVRAGAAAVATTSGAVAWSLGRPDGEGLTRDEMMSAVRRICAAVDVPVTADVEAGYGPSPEDVAATVRAVVEAGAVGVNIEDARNGALLTVREQERRLRAARDAADAAGLPELVINARTDVYLSGAGGPAEVLARAVAYAEAGADCLFVPGLTDLGALRELVAGSPLPVNAMTGPGGPSVADLAAVGVRRVSVGTSIAQAAYGLVERAARELLESGAGDVLDPALGYGDLNALFARTPHGF